MIDRLLNRLFPNPLGDPSWDLVAKEYERLLEKTREVRAKLASARAEAVSLNFSADVLAKFDDADAQFASTEADYLNLIEMAKNMPGRGLCGNDAREAHFTEATPVLASARGRLQ